MIETAYMDSPVGPLEIQGSALGIRSIRVLDGPCPPARETQPVLKAAVQQLEEYFRRERQVFDLLLDFGDATEFYKAVWRELLAIPYGHTNHYLSIAEKLGDPKAVRAVGQAAHFNPIPIVVPCHRCIAKNGQLQGYYYGLDMKRRLLELENPSSFARQGSLF